MLRMPAGLPAQRGVVMVVVMVRVVVRVERVGGAQEGRHGGGVLVVVVEVRRLPLVSLAAPEEAAVVEHVLRHGVQRPVVALAGVARLARDLDEAVVKR